MFIASAYPNSDLSALTMVVIALVMAGSLAAWLGLVFLADRQPRGRRAKARLAITQTERSKLEEGSPAAHDRAAA